MPKSNETNVDASQKGGPKRTGAQSKRHELMEVRIRWKIANETANKANQDRKAFKARMDALSAELKAAPADAAA